MASIPQLKLIVILFLVLLSYLYIYTASLRTTTCLQSITSYGSGTTKPLLIYSLAVNGQKNFDSTRVRLNRERYVKLHEGIEYFHQTKADPFTKLLAWQKVKDYRKVKGGHEWVWLLDSDAFIMNGEISGLAVIRTQLALEAKKNSAKQVDIIIAKDFNGLNSGSLFIRNSSWTDTFIDRWISYENDTSLKKGVGLGIYEQPAFIHMYYANELNLPDHVSIIEQRKINSYHDSYKVGDYVVHFAGIGYARLVKWLREKGLVEV
jgi:hypothetical protein